MNSFIKAFVLVFMCCATSFSVHATHATCGNISLTPTPIPNQYQFILTVCRDCGGVGAPTSAEVTFNNDCGFAPITLTLTNPTIVEVSQLCPSLIDSSECNGGTLPGIQKVTFTGIVTLQPCDSWIVGYSLPARNTSVNLTGGTMYVETVFNTLDGPLNSTPVINGIPIPYVCNNVPVAYNLNANDPDGDSLVFSLTSPMSSSTTPSTFVAPYSAQQPIPGITIDPLTGLISFIPTMTGVFVVAVLIEEYNSQGVLLSSNLHDMQFVVQDCDNIPPEAPTNVTNFTNYGTNATYDPVTNNIALCTGDSISFDVYFYDLDGIEDTITITDNLSNFPGATITVIGENPVTATVTWVFDPGYTSTIMSFTADDGACPIVGVASYSVPLTLPPVLGVGPDTTICGNMTADIQAEGYGPLTWSVLSGDPIVIGTNFSCQGCFNPVATPAITTTYLVTGASQCQLTDTITVNVVDNFGNITADIITPDTIVCPYDSIYLSALALEDFVGTTTQQFTSNPSGTAQFIPANTPAPYYNNGIFVPGALAIGFDTIGNGLANSNYGNIKEVCIDITYDSIGNLDIWLEAPNGALFELTTGNGGPNDDYDICFTPSAIFPVTTPNVPLTGGLDYIPEGGPINQAFYPPPGQPGTVPTLGFWNLVIDNNSVGNFGILNSWSITFCDPFDFPVAAAFVGWDNQQGMQPGPPTATPAISPGIPGPHQYVLSAFDVNMCVETDTITITVVPLPDPGNDSTVQVCSTAGTVDLFNFLGGTPDAGGVWLDSSQAVVPSVLNAAVILDSVPYTYIVTNASGCKDSSTLYVDVVTITGNSIAVDSDCQACNGEVELLINGGITPYSYTNLTSGTPAQFGSVFTGLCGTGNYDFLVTDAIGCEFNISDVVNDINLPVVNDTLITDVSCATFCDGEIEVVGLNLQSYSLNGAPAVASNTFTGLCEGFYDITAYSGTNGQYCSIDILNVYVAEPDPLAITGYTAQSTNDSIIICAEDELALFATGQGPYGNHTFTWYLDNFNTVIGTGANLSTPYNNGNITVIISENNCPQDTATFVAYQPDPIYLAMDTDVDDGCYDLDVVFTNLSTNSADIDNIVWSFSNGHQVISSQQDLALGINPTYTFTEEGIFDVTMTATSVDGCQFDTTYYSRIEAYGYPRLNFTPNPIQVTVYVPTSTMVNLSSTTATNFSWNFGSDADPQTSTAPEPTVTYPGAVPGRYEIFLTGSNDHGCEATVQGEIQIVNDVLIYAPNVFTPDGNNFNETWRAYASGIDVYDFELTVYNRYGEIVWKSYNVETAWDGTYGNGGVVQDGTYPWVITAKDALDDKKYEFKGTVHIVK